MQITIIEKPKARGRGEFTSYTPYDRRYGFWGVVTKVDSKTCTVDVLMDTGVEIQGVKVASNEWVTVDKKKDFVSGERKLPKVNSYVFCMMPTGDATSAFVLCSGFLGDSMHDYFRKEGKESEAEKITLGGWNKTEDYSTGSISLSNKAKKENADIILEVDQKIKGMEKIKLEAFNNKIEISQDGIDFDIKKDTKITLKGKLNLNIEGDANIEAIGKTTIKSVQTVLTGGQVKIAGSVIPTGDGAFCALPTCSFTGALHTGSISQE